MTGNQWLDLFIGAPGLATLILVIRIAFRTRRMERKVEALEHRLTRLFRDLGEPENNHD